MKKIILTLLVVFIFCSCSMDMYESHFSSLASGHRLWINPDLANFHTYRGIGYYLTSQIQYRSESGDDWSNPETTFNRGYGDCDDYAIAFMNIVYLSMGIKMELVLVHKESLEYIWDDDISIYDVDSKAPMLIEGVLDHAMVRYKGVLIEPTTGSMYTGAVYYSFSFDEVFDY